MNRSKHALLSFSLLGVEIGASVLLTIFSSMAWGDVGFFPRSSDRLARIVVFGQIQSEDLNQFTTFAQSARVERQYPSYQVRLNTVGGDMETAIAIARIMRRDKANAIILPGDKCYSSCVFLLAGAPSRGVWGVVGIHRPFSPLDTRMTEVLQKQNYERLEKVVKDFLREVNIPAELYDHMLRIPPHKVAILSRTELQKYGLGENDPYEDAAGDAALAKSLNISVEELVRRKGRANAQCATKPGDEGLRCYMRVLKDG